MQPSVGQIPKHLGATGLEPNVVPVTDPTQARAMQLMVDLQHVTPTRALERWLSGDPTPPSLCLLFQKGQCRAAEKCNQLHAAPAQVDFLRSQTVTSSDDNCCLFHGDPYTASEDFQRFVSAVTLLVRLEHGEVVIPPERICLTLFWDQFLSGKLQVSNNTFRFSANRICRLHQRENCRYGVGCNNVHVCRQFWGAIQSAGMGTSRASSQGTGPSRDPFQSPLSQAKPPPSMTPFVAAHASSSSNAPDPYPHPHPEESSPLAAALLALAAQLANKAPTPPTATYSPPSRPADRPVPPPVPLSPPPPPAHTLPDPPYAAPSPYSVVAPAQPFLIPDPSSVAPLLPMLLLGAQGQAQALQSSALAAAAARNLILADYVQRLQAGAVPLMAAASLPVPDPRYAMPMYLPNQAVIVPGRSLGGRSASAPIPPVAEPVAVPAPRYTSLPASPASGLPQPYGPPAPAPSTTPLADPPAKRPPRWPAGRRSAPGPPLGVVAPAGHEAPGGPPAPPTPAAAAQAAATPGPEAAQGSQSPSFLLTAETLELLERLPASLLSP